MPDGSAKLPSSRLLVVDDAPDSRMLLCRWLERRGYRVASAASGAEALRLLEAQPVDLVLLDLVMPDLDGIEVLRRIRVSRSSAELPVVMVTGRSGNDDILGALLADANDYITKPIDFPMLMQRIEVHLGRLRAEQALLRSEERFALAVAGSNDGIWDWDLERRQVWFSPRWAAQLGLGEAELGNDPGTWFRRVHPDDLPKLKSALQASLDDPSLPFAFEHRLLHKDGRYRWMLARGRSLARDGRTVRIAGSLTETTDRKLADPVTGLPNRLIFRERLETAARAGRDFGLLLVNLDRFRAVNDTFGLHAGDELLARAAQKLELAASAADIVANLGADEFAVLADAGSAVRLAERVAAAFRDPFTVGGEKLYAQASIGLAMRGPEHGSGEEVLRDAQLALRRAKDEGGARIELSDPKSQADALRRLGLERDLRRALDEGEITAWFQPVVRLEDGAVVGFEALARWLKPDGAMVSPAEFIPIAEETGLIAALDARVLGLACAEAARWPDADGKPPYVAVNVSAKKFGDPGLLDLVDRVLAETGLDPRRLKLEITEGTIMRDPAAAERGVNELAFRQVGLAIDDFGTGYSSLAYLHRFRADTLKIDRSFVGALDKSDSGLVIVRAIIGLAQSLKMRIVAEGIETPQQHRILQELGCAFGQGFLFSRPVPIAAVAALAEGRPLPSLPPPRAGEGRGGGDPIVAA
jgi:diguanylate cyclase (GGDEF)-like protein/PAS domain S-box-containing protein